MKKNLLKILIKWVCYLLLLLIVGIDISFASTDEDGYYILWENDWIAKFQNDHPYIFVTGLVLLPVGWLFFCSLTGLDSQLSLKK